MSASETKLAETRRSEARRATAFERADPVLTANLYAAGCLDAVLERVLAPFWRAVTEGHGPGEEAPRFWFLRYDRRGEHWKLRLHADADRRDDYRHALREAIETGLADALASPRPPDSAERSVPFTFRVPPIDAEDAEDEPADDATWCFTTYRRSPVSLGPEPFLGCDACVDAVTRCLGRGSETILELAEDPGALAEHRQGVLVQLLLDALAGLDADQAAYLRYHRDWLIRIPLLKSNGGNAHGREMIDRLDRFAGQRGAQIEQLRAWADDAWSRADAWSQNEAPPLGGDLGRVVEQARRRAEHIGVRVDPFVEDPAWPLVFKVLHGWANALGLGRVDEAFTHHLLLRARAEATASKVEPFALFPFPGDFS